MKIAKNVLELVGNTPLVELSRFARERGLRCRLAVKLESREPAGSVKDRVGVALLQAAEEQGNLAPGGVVIEPTSGNTGIGLAMACAVKGYRLILTMPETMSVERRKLLAAYGAELVLTEGARGMTGAIEKANELAADIPGSFIPGQFDNPANPAAHFATTGPEIWRDTDGQAAMFVAGVGTGGTLTGTGRYLRQQNPAIRLVAAEPAGSPVLSGGKAGPHGLQGIGAGFVPAVADPALFDEIVTVTEAEAYAAARQLAATEGILAGISGGAALEAACRAAAGEEWAGKWVVVLLPDGGDRYLSTPLYAD